jgi:hypothetical protein
MNKESSFLLRRQNDRNGLGLILGIVYASTFRNLGFTGGFVRILCGLIRFT